MPTVGKQQPYRQIIFAEIVVIDGGTISAASTAASLRSRPAPDSRDRAESGGAKRGKRRHFFYHPAQNSAGATVAASGC
jgi:hypothetical protein